MARIRTIKPEAPHSENLGRVSRDARLLFFMLFTLADDEGRARAAPRMLASLLFPYDDDAKSLISEWLTELQREDAVTLYEVEDTAYLQIKKWLVHQKIDKPSKSRLPSPESAGSIMVAKSREESPQYLVPVPSTKEQILPAVAGHSEPNGYPEDFESFWKAYPTDKNMPKKLALKQWRKLSPEDRDAAVRAIPGFRRYCEENRAWYRPIYADRFLSQGKFEGYIASANDVPDMTPERLAELQDRTDRIMERGKYAPSIQ